MILESKFLQAEFSTTGAELLSLKDYNGHEYIWQGAENLWPGNAPILFPITGFLKNGEYLLGKKKYQMPVHGFAAKSNFTLSSSTAKEICFSLSSNEETQKHYPFLFDFTVKYELKHCLIKVTMTVENKDDDQLLFSFGWHPGFNTNWQKNDLIENYFIRFPDTHNELQSRTASDKGLLSEKIFSFPLKDHEISLTDKSFVNRALVFEKPPESLILGHRKMARQLKISYKDFSTLVLWGQPGAPFICLEPWMGLGDLEAHDGDFQHKKGLVRIHPGSSFSRSVYLEIVNI